MDLDRLLPDARTDINFLARSQCGERRIGQVVTIAECSFSPSLAILVRNNRPQEKIYYTKDIEFLRAKLHDCPHLQIFNPGLLSRDRHFRIGLKSKPGGYQIGIPFRIL